MHEKRKFAKRLELATSSGLPHLEFVDLASDPHPKIRLKLAQRFDTPSDVLGLLWDDPAENVRVFVAKHPNALPETLALMAPDPSHRVATEVARRNETPFKALEIIANHKHERVRRTLTKNCKVPRYILMQLAEVDSPFTVIRKIFRRRDLPEELLLKLTKNANRHVRKKAYSRLKLTREHVERMACDECYFIRASAVENPLISDLTLQRLSNDRESFVRSHIASNPMVSMNLLNLLSHDTDYGPRKSAAQHPLATEEMLKRLSFDQSDFVRRTVAENERTPLDVLKKFVIDPSSYVRTNVASNKAVPTAWLKANFPEQFLSEHVSRILEFRDQPPSKHMIARDPLTSIKDLKALSMWQCDLDTLRKEPYTYTEELLLESAFRKEANILQSLMSNPALPPKILDQICCRLLESEKYDASQVYYLLSRAALHPASTPELTDLLLEYADKMSARSDEGDARIYFRGMPSEKSDPLRSSISQNPVTSPQNLRKLAENSSHRIRGFVARNPATPIDTLRKLAVDLEFYVKFKLVRREIIPPEIGQILLDDPIFAEMYQERLSGGYVLV